MRSDIRTRAYTLTIVRLCIYCWCRCCRRCIVLDRATHNRIVRHQLDPAKRIGHESIFQAHAEICERTNSSIRAKCLSLEGESIRTTRPEAYVRYDNTSRSATIERNTNWLIIYGVCFFFIRRIQGIGARETSPQAFVVGRRVQQA